MPSGTINGTTDNQYIRCRLEWESTPHAGSNSSEVTVTLRAWRTNTGYTTNGNFTGRIYINGQRVDISRSVSLGYNSNTFIGEATVTVPHKSDGTKSITIYATGGISGTSWGSTSCSGTANLGSTISAPSAPSAVSHVRVSDTRNTVSWTRNASTAAPYEYVRVERSTNGGAWSQVVRLAGSATSYADTATLPNQSYRYRVRAQNGAGYSGYSSATSTTYNTPDGPVGATATLIGTTTVRVRWTNSAYTDTGAEIQRSTDGGTTWAAAGTVSGQGAAEFTDPAAPSGSVIYRVRHTRGALASAWSAATNAVTTVTPPGKPVITASPAVVDIADGYLHIGWLHNSLDGSEQTAAQVWWWVNGSAQATVNVTTPHAATLDLAGVDPGDTITWQVRTKGLHATYSVWSDLQSCAAAAAPSLTIVTPTPDGVAIESLPLAITWDVFDPSGMPAAWSIVISGTDGAPGAYQAAELGPDVAHVVPPTAFTPLNLNTYAIELTVYSTTGLTATEVRTFTVDYLAPPVPTLEVEVDPETGAAELTAHAGTPAGAEPDTDSIAIFRERDGVRVLIADSLASGTTAVDRVPPLNTDITYVAVAYSGLGLAAEAYEPAIVASNHFFVNFGDDYGTIARCRFNPSLSRDFGSDARAKVRFAGRAFPTLYTGTGRTQTDRFTGVAESTADAAAFEALGYWQRRTVWRTPDGRSAYADCEVSLTPRANQPHLCDVTLALERLDGGTP